MVDRRQPRAAVFARTAPTVSVMFRMRFGGMSAEEDLGLGTAGEEEVDRECVELLRDAKVAPRR